MSKKTIGIVLIAALAVAAAVFGIVRIPVGKASDKNLTPGSDVKLTDAARDDLTVKPGDILPKTARCSSDVWIQNSIKEVREGDPAYRQKTDSMSTPFTSSDKNVMFTDLLAEHCGNPTELDNSIKGLSKITVGDFNVGENNPWMAAFEAAADKHGLRSAFLTHKKGVDGIYVTADYQQYAAMTNTLLVALQNAGVQQLASVSNWHQAGPTAGELPRAVVNSTQENLPALVLDYTMKGVCAPVVRIGYNAFDKRFESFALPTCETPAKPTQPKPSETSGPKPTTPPGTGGPPPSTAPPPTTPPTAPPTTQPPCGRKCDVATTTPTPPPTAPPAGGGTTTPPGDGQSGTGAPPTDVTPPPTVAQPEPPPATTLAPIVRAPDY